MSENISSSAGEQTHTHRRTPPRQPPPSPSRHPGLRAATLPSRPFRATLRSSFPLPLLPGPGPRPTPARRAPRPAAALTAHAQQHQAQEPGPGRGQPLPPTGRSEQAPARLPGPPPPRGPAALTADAVSVDDHGGGGGGRRRGSLRSNPGAGGSEAERAESAPAGAHIAGTSRRVIAQARPPPSLPSSPLSASRPAAGCGRRAWRAGGAVRAGCGAGEPRRGRRGGRQWPWAEEGGGGSGVGRPALSALSRGGGGCCPCHGLRRALTGRFAQWLKPPTSC